MTRWQASRFRSIPAWAGKPRARTRKADLREVHPRVGGETASARQSLSLLGGPSPRGRGNPWSSLSVSTALGSIPAWAGKPQASRCLTHSLRVHPRVGGETQVGAAHERALQGPSPRGRGNQNDRCSHGRDRGSIPAWAGKPRAFLAIPMPLWVHPRVGGETGGSYDRNGAFTGPSPRGRGNHSAPSLCHPLLWSIPAWAGKPDKAKGRHI